MRIITHYNVDLDATCSVWAARRFAPGGQNATVEFQPADWNGDLGPDDLAVDLVAGGRGIKGGAGASAFACLMQQLAPTHVHAIMDEVITFVEAQDTRGNAVRTLAPDLNPSAEKVLSATNLNTVLRAYQALHPRDDLGAVRFIGEILDGILLLGEAEMRAQEEADKATILPGGRVALVVNAKEFTTNQILFNRGVRAIVYTDGCNLGAVRRSDQSVRMDDPAVRAIIPQGEVGEWFAHPSGFLFCRGNRKAPASTPSGVDPLTLAREVDHLFEKEGGDQ